MQHFDFKALPEKIIRHWRASSLQVAVLLAVTLAFLLPGIVLYLSQSWSEETRARAALDRDMTRYSEVLATALHTPLWEFSKTSVEAIVRSIVNDERFISVTVTESSSGTLFFEL